jgi:hypothetical protein
MDSYPALVTAELRLVELVDTPELPAPPRVNPTQRLVAFLGRDGSR